MSAKTSRFGEKKDAAMQRNNRNVTLYESRLINITRRRRATKWQVGVRSSASASVRVHAGEENARVSAGLINRIPSKGQSAWGMC